MRKGDDRIRIKVSEEIYFRRIKIDSLSFGLGGGESALISEGVPSEAVLYEGIPVANWVLQQVAQLVTVNPIVAGSYSHHCRLVAPLQFELPTGPVSAHQIHYNLRISGSWFAQQVTLDATAGEYDWLRRRFRVAPGSGQLEIKNFDFNNGKWIKRPPDQELGPAAALRNKEVYIKLLVIEGWEARQPVPELHRFVIAEDLELVMPDLPAEAYTSIRGHRAAVGGPLRGC